jgi:putative transposase
VRRVHRNGAIRWRGAEIYLSEALIGEPVGLGERQDGGWLVHYGPIELGVIDHRGQRLRKPKPVACGFVDNPDGLSTTPRAQPPQQQT